MFDWFKRVYLMLKGYDNPQKYWDRRWRLRLPEDYAQASLFTKIRDVVRTYSCQSVLEVGCGLGDFRCLPSYLGMDFSLEVLRRSGLPNFLFADVSKAIPLPDKSFDAVLSNGVLLHIPSVQIEHACVEMMRVSRKLVLIHEPRSAKNVKNKPHCFSHDYVALFREASNFVWLEN
jgi:SAM-dependent methyltransferase